MTPLGGSRKEGIPNRGVSLCPRPHGMLAHTKPLLVMPNNLAWTEIMVSKSTWHEMELEGVEP